MRPNPKPDEPLRHSRRQGPVVVPHPCRPGVGADPFEVQTWMAGILFPEPVVLQGQAPDPQGQRPILPPELRPGETLHGRALQPPALKSSIVFRANRSSGPPARASSSICASQSASQRRSRCSFSRQSSCRGSFSMAASISATVLTPVEYPSPAQPSILNCQPTTYLCN